jgi:hypothetical protein
MDLIPTGNELHSSFAQPVGKVVQMAFTSVDEDRSEDR